MLELCLDLNLFEYWARARICQVGVKFVSEVIGYCVHLQGKPSFTPDGTISKLPKVSISFHFIIYYYLFGSQKDCSYKTIHLNYWFVGRWNSKFLPYHIKWESGLNVIYFI